jgi:transcriptional regulator with XRE-family HTH domain
LSPPPPSSTVGLVVPPPTWTPNAPALVAARERRGWSRERLASAAGVHERTVRRAELGQTVGVPSLRLLAGALGVDFEQLAHEQRVPTGRSPERLAAVAATERVHRRQLAIADATTLTAALLEALYTTPLAYHDEVLSTRGHLLQQAPGTAEEARALGAPVGLVGRFELAIPAAIGEPLSVTLHTRDAAGARRVQRALGSEADDLRLRVVAVADGAPFTFFGSMRGHAWTLVVQAGERRAATKSKSEMTLTKKRSRPPVKGRLR